MPMCGFAAGLGKLNVDSGLGEPFKAEIELLSVSPEELSTLTAAIASEEAYAVQGITRLGIHNSIKVELAKNADGAPILKLRSSQPISDPYLDMLIQVDWASGRLLREYTVLLDPPEYKQAVNAVPAPLSINKPSSTSTSTASAASSEGAEAISANAAKTKRTKKSASQQDVSSTGSVDELTTKRGDTLNSIAREMQVEGVSLDQMLVGLYENNKKAFTDGNMNRLKVGQIIKAPSVDTLMAISPHQARQEVKVHSANWNAYRNSLAGEVQAAPVAEESEQKQSASGKIASAEDKAAPVTSGSQDVVRLSAGEPAPTKDGKESAADYNAKIIALQEEATAREKALKESQDRTAALEKQIEDMQKLLALKNQSMADLQKSAETVAQSSENVQPAEPAAVVAPEVKPAAPEPVAQEVKKPAPVAAAPVQAPPPEPTFIESLLDSVNLFVLGGAAGITLLGAGWMFLRNKRRKELDSFERGILTSGGLRANTVFGNTTGNASTSDTSFLTDFAQSADGSMIDTNDVDPIAEAEVYMAYGRDAQAEEILKDAITKEPKRYELHLKLLEMYAGRKDISAFEAIAGELYTTLGADDPTWAKVAELGATVEPDNPLYDVSKIAAHAEASAVDEKPVELDAAKVEADEGLDFSFDEEVADKVEPEVEDPSAAIMQSFASAVDSEQNQTFDLGSADTDAAAFANTQSNIAESTTEAGADNSMEFDLAGSGFDAESADESAAVNAFELPPLQVEASTEEAVLDSAQASTVAAADVSEGSNDNEIEFGLDFNFPETNTEVSAEAPKVDAGVESAPDIALDATEFNFEELNAPSTPEVAEAAAEESAEEISFDFPLAEEQDLPVAEEVTASASQEANDFDFSSISLELGDDESKTSDNQQSAEAAQDSAAPIIAENPDVDIKLDLVKAYIDMDDREGARELLDEVIKEGGPQQKNRAEQLLTSLA